MNERSPSASLAAQHSAKLDGAGSDSSPPHSALSRLGHWWESPASDFPLGLVAGFMLGIAVVVGFR